MRFRLLFFVITIIFISSICFASVDVTAPVSISNNNITIVLQNSETIASFGFYESYISINNVLYYVQSNSQVSIYLTNTTIPAFTINASLNQLINLTIANLSQSFAVNLDGQSFLSSFSNSMLFNVTTTSQSVAFVNESASSGGGGGGGDETPRFSVITTLYNNISITNNTKNNSSANITNVTKLVLEQDLYMNESAQLDNLSKKIKPYYDKYLFERCVNSQYFENCEYNDKVVIGSILGSSFLLLFLSIGIHKYRKSKKEKIVEEDYEVFELNE